MEWQPIETAPYDVPVLVFCPKRGPEPDQQQVLTRQILPRNQGEWWVWGDEYSFEPTHWMPLPKPPANNPR